jgi:recombination protein RecA
MPAISPRESASKSAPHASNGKSGAPEKQSPVPTSAQTSVQSRGAQAPGSSSAGTTSAPANKPGSPVASTGPTGAGSQGNAVKPAAPGSNNSGSSSSGSSNSTPNGAGSSIARPSAVVPTLTAQGVTTGMNTINLSAEDLKAKKKALEVTLSQIDKTFGKGSIMRMDEKQFLSIPGISTGSISLDLALGGRGIPRGRIVEIFGPESSGKTTLALTVASHAQKDGGVAAFIDAEHALDPSWARKLGVNIDDLLVSQPDTGEQALEICELLVRSNAVDIIVVDSVAALVPRAEIEGEMGDASMGLQARLMSQAMRKLTGVIARSNCTVIFINQIREKIGVMFGSPETTTGGRALKFYSSVRIDVRRTGAIKEGEVTVGSRTRARVVKNKIAPPFRDAEFDIMYTCGISAEGDLLDLAVDVNVVQKSGAWFSYGDLRVGQGREASKQFLKDNPELFKEVRQKVLAIKQANPAPAGKPAADDDTDEGDE